MGDINVITLDTVIKRNDTKFLANALGEEMVMMNMENGDFISMNNVGADIWNLSREPVTVKELIGKLLTMYDITPEQCEAETVEFLQASREQNMFTLQ
jgi:Coenzyme PQQ synthesis protein D (PqqD)